MNACTNSAKKDSLAVKPYDTQNHSGNINTPKKDKSIVSTGIFPKPAGLEPAVEFWRKTYAIWARSQVAFHDDRHLDVIYEVMDLP
jgi:membrane-bound lytic murein transglycosylase D